MEFAVKELWTYPIKSCKGIFLSKVDLDRKGFRYDRRFMLTDSNYRFLTQREYNKLALIEPQLVGKVLRVNAPGMAQIDIPISFDENNGVIVNIWKDDIFASFVGGSADAWFSKYLGFETHLVYMPDKSDRLVDPRYTRDKVTTAFTDDFPISLISQASLDDLNSRMERVLPMNRFRPNIVISGCQPFAEDAWKRIKLGEVEFEIAKPSARCIMTTIDQDTGVAGGMEPLKTLSTYRARDNKIFFGQNIIHLQTGSIMLGDACNVLYETR